MSEKLTAEELASLPEEVREEITRQQRAEALAVAPPKAAPAGKRDETLVEVLVTAHNCPWADVAEDYEVEVDVPDGTEGVKVEDGVDDKGRPKYRVEQVRKTRRETQTRTRFILRPMQRRERVRLARWQADHMVAADFVIIL